MAIVKDRTLLLLLQGALGDLFVIYERNGQIILAKRPCPSTKKPSAKQLEARYKLKIAAAYANEILKDPEMKAYYAAKAVGSKQNAYNMAVKDAYNSPEIQRIRLEEETVIVTAKDDFKVAEVEVRVVDAEGVLLERGAAVQGKSGVDWYYKPATLPAGGRVLAVAVDLPGNATLKELLLRRD